MTALRREASGGGGPAIHSSGNPARGGAGGASSPAGRTSSGDAGHASPAMWRATSTIGVRVLAWIWTRVLTERLRVATMWWLNEKVAVRVVAVVPGPHGSVLARVRRGRLVLPSVRLGRDADPEATVRSLVRETCGLDAARWAPIDAVRRSGAALDAIFVAHASRPIGVRGRGRVAWVAPATVRREGLPRWLEAGTP